MVSQQIKDYIEKTRKSGYSEEQIIETLKKSGWTKDEISKAMGKHNEDIPPPAPMKIAEPQPTSAPKTHSGSDQKTNTLAIVAFVLIFFWPASFVLGLIALSQIKKTGEKGKGLAIVAITSPVLFFIVMVMIASFAYFGAFNPKSILAEKCHFPVELSCVGGRAIMESDTITIPLRNSVGFPITVESVSAPQCSGAELAQNSMADFGPLGQQIEIEDVFRIRLTGCNNGNSGDLVQTTVTMRYTNQESGILSPPIEGDIIGRVI